MPNIDLTVTISTILAIAAILVPSITTLLNNHHLYKMRKLDEAAELRKASSFYKRGIYEDYLRYVGQCVTQHSKESLENYGATYSLALIYFPEELIDKIIDLNNDIRDFQLDNALDKLNDISPLIRRQIEKL